MDQPYPYQLHESSTTYGSCHPIHESEGRFQGSYPPPPAADQSLSGGACPRQTLGCKHPSAQSHRYLCPLVYSIYTADHPTVLGRWSGHLGRLKPRSACNCLRCPSTRTTFSEQCHKPV